MVEETKDTALANLSKISHIPALDGLRGIAILLVLGLHLFQSGAPLTNYFVAKLSTIASIGQSGVDLFFVLSGFLITRILLSSKGQNGYFFKFYTRRILRIFPLYYGFLLVYFIICPLLSKDISISVDQIWFWLYLQNFAFTFEIPIEGPNHFWSLAVEEHFYLLWPVIVYYFSLRQLYRTALLGIILCFATRVLLLHYDYGVFYFTFCRIDGLALGGILACMERENTLQIAKKVFIATPVMLILFLLPTYMYLGGQQDYWLQLTKSTLISLFFFCLLGLIIQMEPGNILLRFLSISFLTFTGKISYGLYVLQGIGFYITMKLGFYQSSFCLVLLSSFLINYVIAYLVYSFYETPFLKLKSKLSP